MALILDDDSLLDAADGFAGWDDALVDDTLAQEPGAGTRRRAGKRTGAGRAAH